MAQIEDTSRSQGVFQNTKKIEIIKRPPTNPRAPRVYLHNKLSKIHTKFLGSVLHCGLKIHIQNFYTLVSHCIKTKLATLYVCGSDMLPTVFHLFMNPFVICDRTSNFLPL